MPLAGRFAAVSLLVASFAAGTQPALAKEAIPGMKGEGKAFVYSMAGTAVPIGVGVIITSRDKDSSDESFAAGLIIAGCLAGPSLGHFYAERPVRALTGIGIRTGAYLGLAAGILWHDPETVSSGAAVLGVASALVGTLSVLIDIGRAPKSARIHNAKLSEQKAEISGPTLGVIPALIGKDRAPGLRIDCAF